MQSCKSFINRQIPQSELDLNNNLTYSVTLLDRQDSDQIGIQSIIM
jgi:hypothetical protein